MTKLFKLYDWVIWLISADILSCKFWYLIVRYDKVALSWTYHVSILLANQTVCLKTDIYVLYGELRQKWDVIGRIREVGAVVAGERVIWMSSFYFFKKENWICAMTRHHAEPNINILLTRNLPFASYARQWSHP